MSKGRHGENWPNKEAFVGHSNVVGILLDLFPAIYCFMIIVTLKNKEKLFPSEMSNKNYKKDARLRKKNS